MSEVVNHNNIFTTRDAEIATQQMKEMMWQARFLLQDCDRCISILEMHGVYAIRLTDLSNPHVLSDHWCHTCDFKCNRSHDGNENGYTYITPWCNVKITNFDQFITKHIERLNAVVNAFKENEDRREIISMMVDGILRRELSCDYPCLQSDYSEYCNATKKLIAYNDHKKIGSSIVYAN
ncbi:MAG: hypothetical protein Terrestrivirus1_105 [Terrestrivirus sp.]|uniref:Uncharacterized protein n=1 Tax=Terrestrivirus sp. TaxID=2487775 RepID=A0A3G4ZMG3_9VIRU|nr:MAG: hypothetical protein Terrestrivirus1_105 [Terrestrivirus sp.]